MFYFLHAVFSLLLASVEAVTRDESFKVESSIASEVLKIGRQLQQWLKESTNVAPAEVFAKSVVCQLQSCIPASGRSKSVKTRREWTWSNYHQLRCSSGYISAWKNFLCKSIGTLGHPIFWQSVGDGIFKSLIKKSFPVIRQEAAVEAAPTISHQEMNTLRYAAGYVPRALRKKLKKSANPCKDQLLLCLYDLVDDGDEGHTYTEEWLDLVDRGGLTRVNEMTFQAFLAMELELRNHLNSQHTPNFKTEVCKKLLANEDVAFYWSILSSDWEEVESLALLELVVNLFLTIRGFHYASAWLEEYKAASAKTLQKSKGLRKGLIPNTSSSCTT